MANSEVIIKVEPTDSASSSGPEPGSPEFGSPEIGSPEPPSPEFGGFDFPSPEVQCVEYSPAKVRRTSEPDNDDDYVPYSKRVTCSVCNKKLANRTTLQKHLRIHTGEKPYPCLHCQRRFRQKEHRDKHTKIHTSGRGYQCSVCTMTFGRRHFLVKHMLQAHNTDMTEQPQHRENPVLVVGAGTPGPSAAGQPVFSCDICRREFKHRYNLWRHIDRLHCKNSPFPCDVCGKVFTKASALKVHELIHTGQKPFQCDLCLKCFSQKHHLLRHRLVHLPRSNVMCVLCNKSFRHAAAFFEHMATEHDGDPRNAGEQQSSKPVGTETSMPACPTVPTPPDLECMFCNNVLCSSEKLYVHLLQHCRELLGKAANALPLERKSENRGAPREKTVAEGV